MFLINNKKCNLIINQKYTNNIRINIILNQKHTKFLVIKSKIQYSYTFNIYSKVYNKTLSNKKFK